MNSNGELCNTPFPYILQKKGTGVNILALGDVVGKEAVAYLSGRLRSIIREYKIDFTVINAENSATSNGIDKDSAVKLLDAGADCLTTGNHVFKVSSFYDYLENSHTVIRPLNYPKRCPGKGYTVLDCGFERVLVINVAGRTGLDPADCPFDAIDSVLEKEKGNYTFSVVDVHAEATSEKAAIANYFDGRVNAVFGTHTHVQTADARTLPGGTAFITDLGMCGPVDSILGVRKDIIIDRFRTNMPKRFEIASGEIKGNGAVFTVFKNQPAKVKSINF